MLSLPLQIKGNGGEPALTLDLENNLANQGKQGFYNRPVNFVVTWIISWSLPSQNFIVYVDENRYLRMRK